MGNVHYVGAEPLTFERIEEILTGNMKLELTPEVKERIQRCRDYLDRKIETQSEPLYGITTGFGSLCNKNISPDELSTLQENLVKSHACSVGDEVSPVIVRLMMLLKAHALSLGHSGVQVITVQRIRDRSMTVVRLVRRATWLRWRIFSFRLSEWEMCIIKGRRGRQSVSWTSLPGSRCA